MYRTRPPLNARAKRDVVGGMLALTALLLLNLSAPALADGPRNNPDGGEKKKKRKDGSDKEEEYRLTARFVVT